MNSTSCSIKHLSVTVYYDEPLTIITSTKHKYQVEVRPEVTMTKNGKTLITFDNQLPLFIAAMNESFVPNDVTKLSNLVSDVFDECEGIFKYAEVAGMIEEFTYEKAEELVEFTVTPEGIYVTDRNISPPLKLKLHTRGVSNNSYAWLRNAYLKVQGYSNPNCVIN